MSYYPSYWSATRFLVDQLIYFGAEVRCENQLKFFVNGIPMTWGADNRYPENRAYEEDTLMRSCLETGGWALCAQLPDAERLQKTWKSDHIYWIPLGISPNFFPQKEKKRYDACFVGYLRDPARLQIIHNLVDHIRMAVAQGVFEEDARRLYNASYLGFNACSNYSTEYAYDINMRVFEITGCGIPLVTNYLSALEKLGFKHGENVFFYHNADEVLPLFQECLENKACLPIVGSKGYELVTYRHTYRHRAREVFWLMGNHHLPPCWSQLPGKTEASMGQTLCRLGKAAKVTDVLVHFEPQCHRAVAAVGWGLHPQATLLGVCRHEAKEMEKNIREMGVAFKLLSSPPEQPAHWVYLDATIAEEPLKPKVFEALNLLHSDGKVVLYGISKEQIDALSLPPSIRWNAFESGVWIGQK
jgi:hypothetical protein